MRMTPTGTRGTERNILFVKPTTEKFYISLIEKLIYSINIKQQIREHLWNFQKFEDGRDFFALSLNPKQQK